MQSNGTNPTGLHSFRLINGDLSTGDWDPRFPVPRQLSQRGTQLDVVLEMHYRRHGGNDVIRSECLCRNMESKAGKEKSQIKGEEKKVWVTKCHRMTVYITIVHLSVPSPTKSFSPLRYECVSKSFRTGRLTANGTTLCH
jgi:hypothetical protein